MNSQISKKPFQSNSFVPSARSFRTLYMYIPGFKNNHIAVYDILYHYWNADYGYAWPTSGDIQLESGLGETTVTKVISELQQWGLIEVVENKAGDNKTYNLKPPIEDEAQFFYRFPEARAEKERRQKSVHARAARPKKRERTKTKAPELTDPGFDYILNF